MLGRRQRTYYLQRLKPLFAKIRTIGDCKKRGPIAVVATDDITFGMVRTFSGLAAPIGMRVNAFRQVSDAEEWLQQMSSNTAPAF